MILSREQNFLPAHEESDRSIVRRSQRLSHRLHFYARMEPWPSPWELCVHTQHYNLYIAYFRSAHWAAVSLLDLMKRRGAPAVSCVCQLLIGKVFYRLLRMCRVYDTNLVFLSVTLSASHPRNVWRWPKSLHRTLQWAARTEIQFHMQSVTRCIRSHGRRFSSDVFFSSRVSICSSRLHH